MYLCHIQIILHMNSLCNSIFFFLFLCIFIDWTPLSAQQSIDQKIAFIMKDSILRGASLGLFVADTKTGKKVAAYDEDRMLIPASTFKILTTAAALEHLGPEFKFKTELIIQGDIEDGTLRGNVVLKGYGDPSLGSKAFKEIPGMMELQNQWIQALKAKGIRRIEGDVLVDGSYYSLPPEQPTWSWMDLGNYYASGAWGFNINDNLYEVSFKQSSILQDIPPIIKIEPAVPDLLLVNEIITAGAGTGDNAYFYGSPFQGKRFIRGTIPAGKGVFTIKGSLPDPEKFMAFHFHKLISENGIIISGIPLTHRELSAESLNSKNESVLLTILSPPLFRLVEVANKESNNLICEALLKQLAIRLKGGKYLYQGPDVIREWLRKLGVQDKSFFIEDGSGLSSKNAVSTKAMTELMIALRKKSYFSYLEKSLAQVGKEGTLRSTFLSLPTTANLIAKSGSLGRVRCYTGYLKTQSGKELSFTVMFNQFSCSSSDARKKIEAIVYELALL
jgi:D-alanyl-D-alanine carboxypeptidase/D-alanyl-D-alanine-endopeptidase (penicillin-binding protein 4)